MKLILSISFAIFSVALSELVCDGEDQKLVNVTHVCPITCQTLGKMHCMALIEKPSCQCINGKIMDTLTKKCVTREECHTNTSETPELLCNNENEHYSQTTPACPSTCLNRHQAMRCLAILMRPSCQCNAGTVKDTINSKCVKPEECPQ